MSDNQTAQNVQNIPLQLDDLCVSYRDRQVLSDINFSVLPGQRLAIVGPNGAGKSTLIKACLGLLPTKSGSVELWGNASPAQFLRAHPGRVAYVPQRDNVDLDFPVTALDVAVMGRYGAVGAGRRLRRDDYVAAHKALEKVGMDMLAQQPLGQLSGGQQQRVFIARALAQEADLYFLDEPFAGIDAATETIIADTLKALSQNGKTIIAVHHDLQSLPLYFTHAVLMNNRVIAQGSPADVLQICPLREAYGGLPLPLAMPKA